MVEKIIIAKHKVDTYKKFVIFKIFLVYKHNLISSEYFEIKNLISQHEAAGLNLQTPVA